MPTIKEKSKRVTNGRRSSKPAIATLSIKLSLLVDQYIGHIPGLYQQDPGKEAQRFHNSVPR